MEAQQQISYSAKTKKEFSDLTMFRNLSSVASFHAGESVAMSSRCLPPKIFLRNAWTWFQVQLYLDKRNSVCRIWSSSSMKVFLIGQLRKWVFVPKKIFALDRSSPWTVFPLVGSYCSWPSSHNYTNTGSDDQQCHRCQGTTLEKSSVGSWRCIC